MTILEILALVTGSLGILGVIIKIATYFATFPFEKKIAVLEIENNQLQDKLKEREIALREMRTASSVVLALKQKIDKGLQNLARMVGVDSASILVPYPPSRNTRFAFLSISGPEASRLKDVLLDVNKGIAGQVYASGQAKIVTDPRQDKRWSPAVDKRMSFETHNLLCVPIRLGNLIIGVAQFLNKPGGFTETDCDIMEKAITLLALQVGEFVEQVENFEILGLAYSQNINDGSVIVTDVSSSTLLLKGAHSLPTMDVINMLNEYLEKITLTAIGNGCIIDKFMWDGCLMSINVAKPVPDHRLVAYRTALAMISQFNELKASWLRADYPVEKMFLRIGMSSGPILQVDMGPAQYREKTIIGDPVVIASVLCANAPRDRNLIVADQSIYEAVQCDHIKATKISPREIGKIQGLVGAAYHLSLPNW